MRVVLDNRERALFDLLRCPYELRNLDVGDCCFYVGEDELVLAVERKTLADLAASIKDGRYREQKQRLLGALGRDRVLYVIEGALPFGCDVEDVVVQGIPARTLQTCVFNMLVRDGIRVVRTANAKETAAFLDGIAARAGKAADAREYFGATQQDGGSERPASSSIQPRKSDNHTPAATFLSQVAAVPGVSHKVAEAVVASGIRSMRDLCRIEDEEALAGIQLCSGKRRLGPALAHKILEHCGVSQRPDKDDITT